MRWFALLLSLIVAPALARNTLPTAITTQNASPALVGSPGWLSYCSTNYHVQNEILQSQTFSTSPWTLTNTGASNPVLTANATTAPDGTNTAFKMDLPAVSGANNNSFMYQQYNYAGLNNTYWLTYDIYVKGVVGGETLWVMVLSDLSTTWVRTKITATTQWQRIPMIWSPANSSQFIELGVDLRDPSQSAQSAQSVYIWGAQLIFGQAEKNYIPTTSAKVAAVQASTCPPGVAFRDWSYATAYNGQQVTVAQNTGAYNVDGQTNIYIRPWSKIGANFVALGGCSTGSSSAPDGWRGLCRWSGTGPLALSDAGSNPALAFAAGTWEDHYMLHAAMSPSCPSANRCLYYSAMNTGNASSIGLATSNDGVTWTKSGSNPVITTTAFAPSLPTVIQIGSNLYMYTAVSNNSGTFIAYWKSASSDGINWVFQGIAIEPSGSGDWDAGTSSYIDPFVFLNRHGFYEMIYTATPDGVQHIAYAVSPDGLNWWKYQKAPIINPSSRASPSAFFVGDNSVGEFSTEYIWSGSISDGNITTHGVAATMQNK